MAMVGMSPQICILWSKFSNNEKELYVLLNVIEDMLAMHLSLNKLSDEKFIQKCDVLYRAKGIGMAVQDEQNSCSVPAEMWSNARKVHRKAGAGAYCIPENG